MVNFLALTLRLLRAQHERVALSECPEPDEGAECEARTNRMALRHDKRTR